MKKLLLASLIALLTGCASNAPRLDHSLTAKGQSSRVRFVILHYTVADLPQSIKILSEQEVSAREVASGSTMQLSIRCHGGRTELAVAGPAISGRAQDYVISYRINGKGPVQVAAAPAVGAGIAFKIDPSPLVQSLPATPSLWATVRP